jgi:hypothetical protein
MMSSSEPQTNTQTVFLYSEASTEPRVSTVPRFQQSKVSDMAAFELHICHTQKAL